VLHFLRLAFCCLLGKEVQRMPEAIWVKTPAGIGQVWGVDRGKVLVEMDYMYLVGMRLDQVERIEE